MKHQMNRRHFLRTSAMAGGAVWALDRLPIVNRALAGVPVVSPPLSTISPVSLTTGSDHVDIIFQALQPFKRQIAAAIGNRPVLIKPNCVSHGATALADTPVECLEGILEFLKSIGKTDVTVAENCPGGPEKYRDLLVRVAGYSTQFVNLSWSMQNAIIARTAHENY